MHPVIFIIDDNAGDVDLMKLAFEANGITATFVICHDGIEAMVHLQTVTPDLVLVDVNMPLVEGFEVLNALRSSPRLSAVPAIMVSSSNAAFDRNRALQCGAAEYWVKAYDFQSWVKLVASVPQIIARKVADRDRTQGLTSRAGDVPSGLHGGASTEKNHQ